MIKTRSDRLFDFVNYGLMIIILLAMLYPLYFTIIASISEPSDVVLGRVTIWPKGFNMDAYINVFRAKQIWTGYANTVYYTVFGTLISLFFTIPCAFAMSRRKLHGRHIIAWFFLIPMFFSGGLIPSYLLVKSLGLVNKPYTLVILGTFSVFLMIVTRIYYETNIPEELFEAARIDGCSNFGQFFTIALPLSSTIIAVMALFYGVGRWNDYFTALIFLSSNKYFPLQLVLRNILISGQSALAEIQMRHQRITDAELLAITKQAYLAEAMKYALIFIASAPLLAAYPFLQKYFVKGVMVGSLKG
jgi:putative aldouronate transport system permease protein